VTYLYLLKKSIRINSIAKFKDRPIWLHFFKFLANFIIPFFIILKIKPNTITVINFFVGFLSILLLFIFNGSFFSYSILLYTIYNLLDCCDGGLASFYKNKTFFGKLIDSLSDVLFFSMINLSLALYFYFKLDNLYILIIGSVSSIFICFNVFILDKFSSLVRWCNKENKNNFPPYIRKKNYSRLFYTFEDLYIFGTISLVFLGENQEVSQKILFLIFFVHTINFFFNIGKHIYFGYKFLNYNKK